MAANDSSFLRDVSVLASAAKANYHGFGYIVLAASMIGLGITGFVSGDFASVWQRIPIEHLPGRQFLAYGCAAIELATGVGLLFPKARLSASGALVVFLLLWAVLLKLPAVIAVPQMEATWLGLAEVTVMLAGAWMLFLVAAGEARVRLPGFFGGASGMRNARIFLALSLFPIGLAHFFYPDQTAELVPGWLPWRLAWVYLTGAGSIAAAIALLFGALTRWATGLEAAMLMIITLLVWTPGLTPASQGLQFQFTGFFISTAIASGAWITANMAHAADRNAQQHE